MEHIPSNSICHYFYENCARFADRPAQAFNADLFGGDHGGRLTYHDLRERIEDIACGLISSGFRKGTRAGLMARTSHLWTQIDIAVACCGGVSVTVYSTLSPGEARYIMNDSQCSCLFVEGAEMLESLGDPARTMPHLKRVIVMDPSFRGGDAMVTGLFDLIDEGREWRSDPHNHAAYTRRWKSVKRTDWYSILYTSGTTGQEKGVILTHWGGISRIEGVNAFFEKSGMTLDETDVTLCYLPLSHVFERGSCQWFALSKGACICYADRPATLLQDMQKYNPTWLNCVPRLYEKIYITVRERMERDPVRKWLFERALAVGFRALEYRKVGDGCYDMRQEYNLPSRLPLPLMAQYRIADVVLSRVRALFGHRFRYSFSASASISPDLLRFFYAIGIAVVEGYGSTETFNAAVLNPIDACKPGYIGKVVTGSTGRIAKDGELELAGAGLFNGYLNRPGDTRDAFTRDGWFRTGDIVTMSPDGYLRFIERKKAIICTAVGKNIAPAKIENLFSTCATVEQVFIVGDDRNYITALIVPNFSHFMTLFKREGIEYDRDAVQYRMLGGMKTCVQVGPDFTGMPRLLELVDRDVRAVNEKLESFETVKRYTILDRRFTEENGMLTPTQKTKKKAILEEYAEAIEGMYRQRR